MRYLPLVGCLVCMACHPKHSQPPPSPPPEEEAKATDEDAVLGTTHAPSTADHPPTHDEQVNSCFSLKILDGVPPPGALTLSWNVDTAGRPQKVTVSEDSMHNPHVEACLRKAIATWTYPAPQDGKGAILSERFAAP